MNRRQFLRTSALGATALAIAPRRSLAQPAARQRPIQNPNILFIVADDLNHWLGWLGRNPQTRTPNIDRFATTATRFMRAYCPASLCNPSRAALMSGLRPSTTGVYGNGNIPWSTYIDEKKCLNGYLRANGYLALGAGKVYHIGGRATDKHSEGVEWDTYYTVNQARADAGSTYPDDDDEGEAGRTPSAGGTPALPPMTNFQSGSAADAARVATALASSKDGELISDMQLGWPDIPDTQTEDGQIAAWAAAQLAKPRDKPFFLAVGFRKPHLPWIVPKKYYDMFPLDTIALPPHVPDATAGLPPAGKRWANSTSWRETLAHGGETAWKKVIRAYLASVAFVDTQMGVVFDALEKSHCKNNTIVVLWTDHGWHLGEKQRFGKSTLWEEATHVPQLWRVPGLTPPAGARCDRAVEHLSIYPTLCELAGLPKPAGLEGVSLAPLLADPTAAWTRPALTTYGYKNHALRGENWRYIRYANGDEELYDKLADPYEWHNLANDSKHASVKTDLARWLPTTNAPDKIRDAKGRVSDPQRLQKIEQRRKAQESAKAAVKAQ